MAQILSDLLWYSAALAELYLIGWLIYSRLAREYPLFFSYIVASILQSVCLAPFHPNSWTYARVWAGCEYLILLAQIGAVVEVVRKIRRFHPEDRRFILWLAVTAATLSLLVSTAILNAEMPRIRWDRPLFVQLTMVADRVVTGALAAMMPTFLASVWWAVRVPRVLNRHLWILTLHLMALSIGEYLMLFHWAGPDARYWIGAGQMGAAFVTFLAWSIGLRPDSEEKQRVYSLPSEPGARTSGIERSALL